MLTIYGLFAQNELPVCQLLYRSDNPDHVNHLEVARQHWLAEQQRGRVYDGIMVITGSDQAQLFTFK